MNKREIVLLGKFDSLNKLIGATNYNKYVGNGIKQRNTKKVAEQVKDEEPIPEDAIFSFHWYLSNRKSDPDNISSATKFVLDGFQEAGIMENDGAKQVRELHHYFYYDAMKDHEYVKVVIEW